MKTPLTLCIVHQHPRVLLGYKKRGFGQGRWNGFGGKVHDGETIVNAAKREIKEEAGINVKNLDKVGLLEFEFVGDPQILEVHIFRAENFDGQVSESEEMKPQWFNVAEIPFAEMWPDDQYWFPLFLSKKKFIGKFIFKDVNVILEHTLKKVRKI